MEPRWFCPALEGAIARRCRIPGTDGFLAKPGSVLINTDAGHEKSRPCPASRTDCRAGRCLRAPTPAGMAGAAAASRTAVEGNRARRQAKASAPDPRWSRPARSRVKTLAPINRKPRGRLPNGVILTSGVVGGPGENAGAGNVATAAATGRDLPHRPEQRHLAMGRPGVAIFTTRVDALSGGDRHADDGIFATRPGDPISGGR